MATNNQPTIWAIRAGGSGEMDGVFLKQSIIAVGWPGMGDMQGLPPSRDAFKARLAETHPDQTAGTRQVWAGQIYRFVIEMKPGDLVVYPSKIDRQIHIGEITGPYYHDTTVNQHFCNLRKVKWLKTVPRTAFSQGALYEMNSALTLFLVRNYADEVLAKLQGSIVTAVPVEEDESVAATAEEIQGLTIDFILKQLSNQLKGHPLAEFVAHLLGTMGYRYRISPPGPDGGVDIIAHKDELGFEPPIVKVQVKSGGGAVGRPEVQALYGTLAHGEFALLITLGTFVSQARDFAGSKNNLRLIDGFTLAGLVLEHYEQFDSRYKSIIPLKRVYVPETIEKGSN